MGGLIGEDLAELATKGVAVMVATRDAACVPELSRGWGIAMFPDLSEVEICVQHHSGGRCLENLAQHPEMAVTLVLPSTYQSFQLKGRAVTLVPATADDLERVARHHRAFVEEVAAVGLSADGASRLFAADRDESRRMTKVRVAVDSVFDQTPGPGAGARI